MTVAERSQVGIKVEQRISVDDLRPASQLIERDARVPVGNLKVRARECIGAGRDSRAPNIVAELPEAWNLYVRGYEEPHDMVGYLFASACVSQHYQLGEVLLDVRSNAIVLDDVGDTTS